MPRDSRVCAEESVFALAGTESWSLEHSGTQPGGKWWVEWRESPGPCIKVQTWDVPPIPLLSMPGMDLVLFPTQSRLQLKTLFSRAHQQQLPKKKKNPSQYSIKPQNCKTWDGCSIRQGHPIEPLGWWTCPVRCVVQHGPTAGPWNAAGVTEDLSFSSVSFQLIKSEIYIATFLFWQMDQKKKKNPHGPQDDSRHLPPVQPTLDHLHHWQAISKS